MHHRWVNYAGCDSLFAVAADRRNVYIGGHERWANNADGCKVGDTYLEVISFAHSTEHSYNDEETLKAARPKALIQSYDELLPKLKELTPLG